jgi:CDP-diacylglycerol--inositol 3-phosphatidyltransferase
MDSSFPWALAGISAPFMLIKQYINVIQLIEASKWLAEGDVEERRRLGLPKRKKAL